MYLFHKNLKLSLPTLVMLLLMEVIYLSPLSVAIARGNQNRPTGSCPLKDLSVPTLNLSRSNDFDKYDFNKGEKIKAGSRVLIPVAAGITLIFISGPAGFLPVGVGITLGAKAMLDSFRRSKTKKTLRGALLFLNGEDRNSDPKKSRFLSYFDQFFLETEGHIRDYFWPEASTWQLKTFLASRLLLINQFGFLIANRCHSESHRYPGFTLEAAPSDGIFTKTFLKQNLIPLILILEDCLCLCSPEFLHRLAFGDTGLNHVPN